MEKGEKSAERTSKRHRVEGRGSDKSQREERTKESLRKGLDVGKDPREES